MEHCDGGELLKVVREGRRQGQADERSGRFFAIKVQVVQLRFRIWASMFGLLFLLLLLR